jgi:phosphopantothenoylcysteine decarboxylase/phosphopantothenate--cysteine ligase
MIKGKKIVIGVTGGIAAYKAAELVRLFVKAGAQIQVVMTKNATRFVTPLTFEALSGEKVIQDMWQDETPEMEHVHLGQKADLIIIAPATANILAKMAHGLADDFLSTMLVASTAKTLICPAMNVHMYQNEAVRVNSRILEQRGFFVMDAGEGDLACKAEGTGRLPEPMEIFDYAVSLLTTRDLEGLRFLVTAGPTVEPIDPVRYMTNWSSGKMGYAIAKAARDRGGDVTLISGPTHLPPPHGVEFYQIKTTEEMRQAVLERSHTSNVVIKAAAPLDYRPKTIAEHKIKKLAEVETLGLERTPDILAELGASKNEHGLILVGFAAETQDLEHHAAEKVKKKNLDMIVANDVSRSDAGFATDTNLVKIIDREGTIEELPLMSKEEVANRILDRVKILWLNRH